MLRFVFPESYDLHRVFPDSVSVPLTKYPSSFLTAHEVKWTAKKIRKWNHSAMLGFYPISLAINFIFYSLFGSHSNPFWNEIGTINSWTVCSCVLGRITFLLTWDLKSLKLIGKHSLPFSFNLKNTMCQNLFPWKWPKAPKLITENYYHWI